MSRRIAIAALLVCMFAACAMRVEAQDSEPAVHCVLFYSPTCPHCEYVITETLPPLLEKYGSQLQIIGVDVTQPQGQQLFIAALHKFGMQSGGLPFLVVGNDYLVGSLDIPEKLPALIETYLAQGGTSWPDIPGLQEALAVDSARSTEPALAAQAAPNATPVPSDPSIFETSTAVSGSVPTDTDLSSWVHPFAGDPVGSTTAVVVLVLMLGGVAWAAALFRDTQGHALKGARTWGIPVLASIGLAVAAYLAYVETANVTAVCGPVGDCNTVQQSAYARLFGVLPIGVLGIMGYLTILGSWLLVRYAPPRPADLAALCLFAMSAGGTLFSIYLTFLEPFVIGATCAWCLSSAVIIAALMLLAAGPARMAYSRMPFAAKRKKTHAPVARNR
jgi:uncharacterized membrane protein/thiol-disulfide isomerase/thioredoxin